MIPAASAAANGGSNGLPLILANQRRSPAPRIALRAIRLMLSSCETPKITPSAAALLPRPLSGNQRSYRQRLQLAARRASSGLTVT